MIGVSPAFFFSLFSTDFTPSDYMEGISRLKALGFEAYQLEIYHRQSLPLGKNKQQILLTTPSKDFASQFVVLLPTLIPSLLSDVGLLEMERVYIAFALPGV